MIGIARHRLAHAFASITAGLMTAGLMTGCGALTEENVREISPRRGEPRVLCVVAHPDDEMAFGGTLYKSATHLGGTCDIVCITRGGGGYKYSTLAESIYGLELTNPDVGRQHLPAIRQNEMAAGAAILNVHRLFFLRQTDHRYTQDPLEVLAPEATVWDLEAVRSRLDEILSAGNYDYLLTHLPVHTTHGHHKAATVLALEAVLRMPENERPIALGAGTRKSEREENKNDPAYTELDGFAETAIRTDIEPLTFNRAQKFGYKEALDYHIVINWAIAEHRSQGTMQTFMRLRDEETFQFYSLNREGSLEEAQDWFRQLATPQFAARKYDADGR